MKIKDTFSLKEVGDIYMLFPVGQNVVDYANIIRLNGSGYFIATKLLNEITYDELLSAMVFEYDAAPDEVHILKKDLDNFLHVLDDRGILED